MAAVWDVHFGFLYAKSTVIIGEWGGPLKDDADRSWQHEVVDYLIHRDHVGSFYWCLNPNSGDTGGILLDVEEAELLRLAHAGACVADLRHPLLRPLAPRNATVLAFE